VNTENGRAPGRSERWERVSAGDERKQANAENR